MGGWDGGGAKLYDSEKAGYSKNHPILSGYYLDLQRKIEANAFAIRPGKLPNFISIWAVSCQLTDPVRMGERVRGDIESVDE
jgi:hypothetical protein